jgi:hypothetical protein
MARSTATITSELQQDSNNCFHLIELHFDDATWDDVFLTDNFHDIDLDTPTQSTVKTFTAVGGLLGFAPIQETTKLAVNSITVSLSGVDNSTDGIISKLMTAPIMNKRVIIYRSFGVANNTDTTKTYLIFDGNVKSWSIDESEDSSQISVNVATHWANFEQKNGRMTNSSTQRNTVRYNSTQAFTNDDGLVYASAAIGDIQWGPTN